MKLISLRVFAAFSFLVLGLLARGEEPVKSVVFVCEHGAVKSVMAASFFNRMAEDKKLNVRAIARGTTPDAEVPAWAVKKLKEDGFDVATFKPQALVSQDASQAVSLVAFCDVPKDLAEPKKVTTWLDVPPASEDYEKAKAAMQSKIAAMVAEMKSK